MPRHNNVCLLLEQEKKGENGIMAAKLAARGLLPFLGSWGPNHLFFVSSLRAIFVIKANRILLPLGIIMRLDGRIFINQTPRSAIRPRLCQSVSYCDEVVCVCRCLLIIISRKNQGTMDGMTLGFLDKTPRIIVIELLWF